jgi:hypothetical protein
VAAVFDEDGRGFRGGAGVGPDHDGECSMLWTIVVILVILWLLGFSLHVAGGLIHILLIVALVVGLVQLFTGRRV